MGRAVAAYARWRFLHSGPARFRRTQAHGRPEARWARTRSMAMTHRISYRRHLAGAMTVAAALLVNAPTASAQPSERQARIAAGMDEAVKALDSSPKLKKMSPQAKKQLV